MSRRPLERVLDLTVTAPLVGAVAATGVLKFTVRGGLHLAGTTAAAVATRVVDQLAGPPDVERVGAPTSSRGTSSDPADAVEVVEVVEESGDVDEPDVALDADLLPIDGYDHLAARQVVQRLADLTPDELRLVADHERANRRRQTVLGKIDRLLDV